MPKNIEKPPTPKWNESMILKVLRMTEQGMSEIDICYALGVPRHVWWKWKRTRPALKEALKEGKRGGVISPEVNQQKGGVITFLDYVFRRLPRSLQDMWRKIRKFEKSPDVYERVEELLKGQSEQVIQTLFAHALVSSNFDASVACRRLNLTRGQVNAWIRTSPNFARLIDEINWHKGNFFESALIKSVQAGDSAAIIFANRTYNKNRGYSEKLEIETTRTTIHKHELVESDLSLELRKQLLEALKKKKQGLLEHREVKEKTPNTSETDKMTRKAKKRPLESKK